MFFFFPLYVIDILNDMKENMRNTDQLMFWSLIDGVVLKPYDAWRQASHSTDFAG